jgi:hypothetical protein
MPFNLVLLIALVSVQSAEVRSAPVSAEVISTAEPQAQDTRVAAGTLIPLVIDETLSTKTHATGDTFAFHVSENVLQNGHTVFPIGTKGVGELYRVVTKGAFGKSGKLEARMLYIELGDRTVRVNGSIGASGKGATTETVATAILAGTIAFAVTGKSATIEKGTKLQARLERDIWVTP